MSLKSGRTKLGEEGVIEWMSLKSGRTGKLGEDGIIGWRSELMEIEESLELLSEYCFLLLLYSLLI